MRDKFLSMPIPESYEAPELLDPLLHFVPIKQFVIRKEVTKTPQKRRLKGRSPTRTSLKRYVMLTDEVNELQSADCFIDTCLERYITRQRTAMIHTVGSSKSVPREEDTQPARFMKTTEVENMDQAKSYSKYFANANIERILKRFNPVEEEKASRGRTKKKTTRVSLLARLDLN